MEDPKATARRAWYGAPQPTDALDRFSFPGPPDIVETESVYAQVGRHPTVIHMDRVFLAFGIIASLLHVAAYSIYVRQAIRGTSKPNAASWAVWAFLATLNALTYREMTGDWIAALQFTVGSGALILAFLAMLFVGRFGRLNRADWFLLGMGVLASAVWWRFQSAASANMILLAAFVISFVPTWKQIYRRPEDERPLTWYMWAAGYGLTVLIALARVNTPLALFMPLFDCLSHGSIGVLSRASRRQRFAKVWAVD
jgi:hypothetical protein